MSANPYLSVVIPVFNEQGNVDACYKAVIAVLDPLQIDFEIIFSDDGSKDATYAEIAGIHSNDSRVRGISLSRNFGHQTALHAGMNASRGQYVICMDGDLQHPPSMIPELLAWHDKGYDIVNTRRIDGKETGAFKKMTSRWYYKLINSLSDVPIEPASADFRSMSREAVDALLAMPERQRFTRGLVSWMGFRQTIIDYQVQERHSGTSKYTFYKMLRFGLDGVVSFSVKPLRIAFYIGLLISLASVLYGLYAIVIYLLGEAVPGWTSILVSVLFIGGAILLSLGVIGEYVARIYNEVRKRPMYFLKDSTDHQNRTNEPEQD